jgi:hypothetical protein
MHWHANLFKTLQMPILTNVLVPLPVPTNQERSLAVNWNHSLFRISDGRWQFFLLVVKQCGVELEAALQHCAVLKGLHGGQVRLVVDVDAPNTN